MTFSCWLRHLVDGCDIVLLICLELCRDIENYVAIETATFSAFLLLFCLFSISFQLTPAKHKVGGYSIFWHKNRYETFKNMPEK